VRDYYFVYDPDNKQEYACTCSYYDKYRKDLVVIALGTIQELSEFVGSDILIIDEE
jgi:hypothetical protein